jgi:molybdopterin-containing oxidoreductase family iron-sulfur binding subunit
LLNVPPLTEEEYCMSQNMHMDKLHPKPGATTSSSEAEWLNLDAFVDDPDFGNYMQANYPREAAIVEGAGMNRRSFLKLMGASMVLGGLTLSGCAPARPEHEAIIPYVRNPENLIPGKPLFFASTIVTGGVGVGIVIETHEGRPHRVDSNPNHPGSAGGSSTTILASVLELYNPARTAEVRRDGNLSSWDEFAAAFDDIRDDLGDGSGIRILTQQSSSPALAQQVEDLQQQYPGAQWYQYEPIGRNNVSEGARLAFGDPVNTYYDISQADTILSLDSNFLGGYMPGSLHYARDFAERRKVRADEADNASMNRLYAVESTPTITGANADHRQTVRATEVAQFAQALANAVGADGGAEVSGNWDDNFFNVLVEDLQASGSNSVVIVGDEQPPAVHALVHAINAALGNVGTTVLYTEPLLTDPRNTVEQLSSLTSDITSGNVDALFIIGGNPAFTAPADVPFGEAINRVPFSVHVGTYYDETSEQCVWHVPEASYIETWGDSRAYDGTASVIQPPIGAIFEDARSVHEMLAFIADDERGSYEVVRDYWQNELSGDFETAWRTSLHNGVIEGTAFDTISPSLSGSLADDVSAQIAAPSDGIELILRPDPNLYDGRYAYNSWLQEVPEAITKLTWDNYAQLSPATADRLRLENTDLINLTIEGRTIQAPVWVVDHHPDDSVTVYLGYGQGISAELDAGLNFNAYPIRTSDMLWIGNDVQIERTGDNYLLARTQKEFETYGTDPVRYATLAEFMSNPNFAEKKVKGSSFLEDVDFPDLTGEYQWGMTIDLTSCIGCNACMVGCQSENNIPAVGKQEVLQERDLHWIRIDRYDAPDGGSHFQPVPCMHCENAPCEYVCPVQATVHDHEGLNLMIYQRCIGTRACSANCPYSVRKFNFKDYIDDAPTLVDQRNPDVTVRMRGVMEKCTYCVQRISAARAEASRDDRPIRDGEVTPACATACPTKAIHFGDVSDPSTRVSQEKARPLNYGLLEEINTVPRTTYLAELSNPNTALVDAAEAGTETTEGDS